MTTHHPKICMRTFLQLVGLTTEKLLPTALLVCGAKLWWVELWQDSNYKALVRKALVNVQNFNYFIVENFVDGFVFHSFFFSSYSV